jgi:hypothetical protein
VNQKIDNLGRNIRRKRNLSTGLDGKAGRPRKRSEGEKHDDAGERDIGPEQEQEIDVIDLDSESQLYDKPSSTESSIQPSTRSTSIQQIPDEKDCHIKAPSTSGNKKGTVATKLRAEDYVTDVDSLYDWM